jgi:hypothetical protein
MSTLTPNAHAGAPAPPSPRIRPSNCPKPPRQHTRRAAMRFTERNVLSGDGNRADHDKPARGSIRGEPLPVCLEIPSFHRSRRNPDRGTGAHKRTATEQPRQPQEPQERRCQLQSRHAVPQTARLQQVVPSPSTWFSFSFLSTPAAKSARRVPVLSR